MVNYPNVFQSFNMFIKIIFGAPLNNLIIYVKKTEINLL